MTTKFSEVVRLPEFEKDIRKLCKKYRTIEDDLENLINTALYLFHKQRIDIHGIVQIAELGIQHPKIYKVKSFACRSLKGKGVRSGIRVIYAYFEDLDKIELIEIYYKGDKENENKERILRCYGAKG